MSFPRPVSCVLTVLLHLGTSDASHNQGQLYAPQNGQYPGVESQSVTDVCTSLSSYNTGEPIHALAANHEPTCVHFPGFYLNLGTCENCPLECSLYLETHWNLVSIRPQGRCSSHGGSLVNCTGNRKWESTQPAFCGSFTSTAPWPLAPCLLVV